MNDEMKSAGGAFLPNGDLWVSYHRPKHRILVQVVGFRDVDGGRRKVLVDSWVLECHPCCGVPKDQGHAHSCRRAPGE